MNDTAITEETRAAVIQCCARRPCLAECLERMSGKGGGLYGVAGVDGAAHIRDSVVCGRSSRPRRTEGRRFVARALEACARMLGALRIGRAARTRFTRVIMIGSLALFSLSAAADLQVEWITDDVIMVSGYGSGGIGTSNITVVVTNILGACTNCLAISKEDFDEYMEQIVRNCNEIIISSTMIHLNCMDILRDIRNQQADISLFFHTSGTIHAQWWNQITNHIATVNCLQSSMDQALINSGTLPQTNVRHYTLQGYNDGIYDYATQYVSPALSVGFNYVETIDSENSNVSDYAQRINTIAQDLISNIGPCECSSNSNSCVNNPGSNTGGISQDQLDAILDYLEHIDQDQHRRFDQLSAISNDLSHVRQKYDEYARRMVDAIYSTGLGLPSGADNWRIVYLDQQPTAWGYNPTNVLSRIELLLAGISGIQTNDVVASTEVLDDVLSEGTSDQLSDAYSDLGTSITSSADAADAGFTSFTSAIKAFFSKFNSLSGDTFANQAIIPSVSVEIGEERYDVPALVLDQASSTHANMIQAACRTVASSLYWIAAGFAGFRFYVWFFDRAGSVIKWAVELLQGLFA